ncbi:hypothetical protein PFISCL1PPCAC_20844, partial [Pristionchus fissidentatus]
RGGKFSISSSFSKCEICHRQLTGCIIDAPATAPTDPTGDSATDATHPTAFNPLLPTVILSCGHVICLACTNTLPRTMNRPKQVKCSLCNTTGAFFLLPSADECRNCSTPDCSRAAASECVSCRSALCEICQTKHRETMNHTEHRPMSNSFAMCHLHSLVFEKRCSCGELLCSACVINHAMLDHASVDFNKVLFYGNCAVMEVLLRLQAARYAVDLRIREVENCVEKANVNISQACAAIMAQTLNRCLDLMEQVSSIGRSTLSNLTATRDNIDRLTRKLHKGHKIGARLSSTVIHSSTVIDYTKSVSTALLDEPMQRREEVKNTAATLDSIHYVLHLPYIYPNPILQAIARFGINSPLMSNLETNNVSKYRLLPSKNLSIVSGRAAMLTLWQLYKEVLAPSWNKTVPGNRRATSTVSMESFLGAISTRVEQKRPILCESSSDHGMPLRELLETTNPRRSPVVNRQVPSPSVWSSAADAAQCAAQPFLSAATTPDSLSESTGPSAGAAKRYRVIQHDKDSSKEAALDATKRYALPKYIVKSGRESGANLLRAALVREGGRRSMENRDETTHDAVTPTGLCTTGEDLPGSSTSKRIKMEKEEEVIDGSKHMQNLMKFVEDCDKAVKYEEELEDINSSGLIAEDEVKVEGEEGEG